MKEKEVIHYLVTAGQGFGLWTITRIAMLGTEEMLFNPESTMVGLFIVFSMSLLGYKFWTNVRSILK